VSEIIVRVFVNKLPERCSKCPMSYGTDMGDIESVISCPVDEYLDVRPEGCPLILDSTMEE